MYEGRETRKQLCDMYVCLMMAFCAKQDSDPTKGAKTKINVQKCVDAETAATLGLNHDAMIGRGLSCMLSIEFHH